MKINTSTLQVQKQILAPMMRQSIEVLLLPVAELTAAIEQELQENPMLETDEAKSDRVQAEESEFRKNLEKYQELSHLPTHQNALREADDHQEYTIPKIESLQEHLLSQLRIEISDKTELAIGEQIIGNLDESGYLKLSTTEIAQSLNIDDIQMVERVLSTIQHFDPIGIAARDFKECLMIQMEPHDECEYKEEIINIIINYLDDLARKRYDIIAKKLKVKVEVVRMAAECIAKLEPKPACNFHPVNNNIYIVPDVLITKETDESFKIDINHIGVPKLRVNPLYKNLLDKPGISPSERKYVKEKLTNAMNFIKCVGQRGQTLKEITQYILDQQKSFFEGKDENIVPMTMKEIAQHLNRNESTISRAINNKYMDTPQGLFAMKFFFSQAIFQDENKNISSIAIKQEIEQLVADEDKQSPLSDQAIQDHFARKGMKLARRTLSKYRQALNIPASHLRKQV